MPTLWPQERFRIALSFPSEHRDLVRRVAAHLSDSLGHDAVFLDEWYEVELAGPDSDLKLRRVYETHSDLVVPFFSSSYEKPWCQLEWSSIRAMLLERHKKDAVLPIRLDDANIEGWPRNAFWITAGGRDHTSLAEIILKKLSVNDALYNHTSLEPASISNADAKGSPIVYAEQQSTDVEVSRDNWLPLPRKLPSILLGAVPAIAITLPMSLLGVIVAAMIPMKSFRFDHALVLVILALMTAGPLIMIRKILQYVVCHAYRVDMFFSSHTLMCRRRMPAFVADVLGVPDRVVLLRTADTWWTFKGGLVAVADSTRSFSVYCLPCIYGEQLIGIQSDLASRYRQVEQEFRVGRPSVTRFYSEGYQVS